MINVIKGLLKKFLLRVYVLLYSNKGYVSVGDIFYIRGHVSFIQYILMARLLDIEKYRKDRDTSFYYTNTLSRITGNIYSSDLKEREIINNNNFKKLLQSVDEIGYDEESRVLINGDYYLANGTHRAALCLNIRKHIIPALYIGDDIYFDDSFISQLESTNQGSMFKSLFDSKLREIEEQLKREHVLCSCIISANIGGSTQDLVISKINGVSSFVCRYDRIEPQDSLYIGFLPKRFDYTIKHGKLYFKSILKLKKEVERLVPGCYIGACFIDGEKSLEAVG